MTSAWHWEGVLDRSALKDDYLAKIDRLANAARGADWDSVFGLAEDLDAGVNTWRVGGKSLFTPLHQAAWHGAPVDVVERLLDRGAWRTLRTADGRTAFDIAQQRGHRQLLETLAPAANDVSRTDELSVLDARLAALIDSRIRPQIQTELRYPQSSVLTEVKDLMSRQPLWFPVPGMYGGFEVTLVTAGLRVMSWSRMSTGSGQEHLVTADSTILIDEGFV